ncbi:50S ribosomal protein L19 [Patescibacteria group bacterium]|nr:50S ribosomal protein L19 [Patescibacteria group bacterium]
MSTEEKKEEKKQEEQEEKKEEKISSASSEEGKSTKEEGGQEKEDESPKKDLPVIKPGMLVKVHQKIKELDSKGKEKERVQVFEGLVIACHGGREAGATFTVRKVTKKGGVAVEKIFPLHLPNINKIEIVKKHRVRRAKLYFLRGKYKKKMKEIKG